MTSANVTVYVVTRQGKEVAQHREHILCKSKLADLLKFTPFEEHRIQKTWLDEEEAYHEEPDMPLRQFLLQHKLIERLPTDPPEFVEVLDYQGSGQVLVPYCCAGKVICRVLYERVAHRNLLEEPVFKSVYWHCQTCDRELTARPKPERPPRKPLSIK